MKTIGTQKSNANWVDIDRMNETRKKANSAYARQKTHNRTKG